MIKGDDIKKQSQGGPIQSLQPSMDWAQSHNKHPKRGIPFQNELVVLGCSSGRSSSPSEKHVISYLSGLSWLQAKLHSRATWSCNGKECCTQAGKVNENRSHRSKFAKVGKDAKLVNFFRVYSLPRRNPSGNGTSHRTSRHQRALASAMWRAPTLDRWSRCTTGQ